jgi:hypothetical protein
VTSYDEVSLYIDEGKTCEICKRKKPELIEHMLRDSPMHSEPR